jgi:ATP-dependent Lon protease
MLFEGSSIPAEFPIMTLPGTVFFPQAMLPLYIFEPRYRQMLDDVLEGPRLFAVAARREDDQPASFEEAEEDNQPYTIATVGVVRASQQNDDGTSNLILQGLHRIRIEAIVQEEPYRIVRAAILETVESKEPEVIEKMREEVSKLIRRKRDLGGAAPKDVLEFLDNLEDPEIFIDMAAYALTPTTEEKQRMLEILDLGDRYRAMKTLLRNEIEELELMKKLRGDLGDEDISQN